MKNRIEGKAREYAPYIKGHNRDSYMQRKGFEAGAQWMHSELTRWRDVKEELPEKGERVLVQSVHMGTQLAYLNIHSEWTLYAGLAVGEVAHWLPIPEFGKELEGISIDKAVKAFKE